MRSHGTAASLIPLFLLTIATSYSEEALWVRGTGGPPSESHGGIVLDGDGQVYTSGRFAGTIDFDPGPGTFELTASGTNDMFITKMDRDGRLLWVRQFGGTGGTIPSLRGFASDAAGNLYVAGGFSGTTDFDPGPGTFNLTSPAGVSVPFIVKLDAAGQLIWARQIGGPSPTALIFTLTVTQSSVVVAGEFWGPIDLDPGPGTFELTAGAEGDGYILALDTAGSFLWAGSIAGPMEDFLFHMVAEPGGHVYVVGRLGSADPADVDPGPGVHLLTTRGFVARVDATGNLVWARPINSGYAETYGAVVDPAGHIHASGGFLQSVDFDPGPGTFILTSAGGLDGFITEFDGDGTFIRALHISGASSSQNPMALAADSSGNVYATGSFFGTTDFDPGPGTFNLASAGSGDVYAAKFDPAGNLVWAAGAGGSLSESAHDIALDSSNNVHVVGLFNGTTDFDPGPGSLPLTSAGAADIFVWKYGSCDIRLEGNAATTIRFGPDAPSLSFDIVTGPLSALRGSGGYSQASCLGSFSANPAADASIPPVGDAYYYLSRGRSICAAQGYGNSTLTPDPRDELDLAGPCP